MSNKVWIHFSNIPYSYGVSGMQVYGTIPQLSSVFAKTCNSNIFLYDQIINLLFFSLQWFSTSSWTFSNVSYFFLIKLIYTYIYSNLRSKYMKLKHAPHTTTYNGLYTSLRIISNKLVVHSSLSNKKSFNHL